MEVRGTMEEGEAELGAQLKLEVEEGPWRGLEGGHGVEGGWGEE